MVPTPPPLLTQAEEPPAAADPVFSREQVLRVITGILICMLLGALDQTVVVPAVPAIAADLNSYGHLSWVISAYLLTTTAATPIYGKLSDLYGRRALLLPAIVWFVAASLLCGMAQSLPQLVAFRALQGLGGAGLLSMAQASIADVVAPRQRGKYQAYFSGVWAAASIGGPVLGGWITDALSWRWIFWLNLPVGALAFIVSSRALRILPVRRVKAKIDYAGAILLTAVITCVLLILSWGGETFPWLSWPITELGAGSLLALWLLVLRERRAPEPLLPPRMFGNSVLSLGVAAGFLASACIFAAAFLLPLMFQLLYGASAAESGGLVVPFLAGIVVGAFASGQAARRLGRGKALMLGGFAAAAVGFLLLANVGENTNRALIVLYMAVASIGIGFCMPSSLVMVQNAAERQDVGTATAALLFLRSMGGAFGSTLTGSLLATHFAARMAEGGLGETFGLGVLRGHGATASLDAAARMVARAALVSGFNLAFLTCALLAAVGFLITLPLRDLPLRA
ncbi:MAG TPA: MFS transporter [Rhodospirillaceae bacterium]|nr:MFS transporter [Rhodospirillaceae bacterium]